MIWFKDVVFKIDETWFFIIIIMFWFCVSVLCVGVNENGTCESYVFFFLIKMGVPISLRAPRLISRDLKLTTI